MSAEVVTKKINELQVNKYNPRFIKIAEDEVDAINKIIDLDPKKMLNLLNSLDEVGWHNDILIAYEDNKTKAINLMDGNRRLSALKIILQPGLIALNDQNAKIIEKCNSIDKSKFSETILYVELWSDLSEALYKRIEEKHINDETQLAWSTMAKYRFSRYVGNEIDKWIRILIYYFNDDEKVEKILDKKVDIYRRILTGQYTSEVLKVNKTLYKFDYINDKKVMEALINYVNTSKKALTREDNAIIAEELSECIKKTINEEPPIIIKKDKNVENASKKETPPNVKVESAKPVIIGEPKRRRKYYGPSNLGLYLIRKNIPIKNIKLTKILDLIEECQNLSLYEYPHAACYLFRSIIQLSIDNYMNQNPAIEGMLPPITKKDGTIVKDGSLRAKSEATALFLYQNKQINSAVYNSILVSISTQKVTVVLNGEVHSLANSADFVEIYKNSQPLVDLLLQIA